jgi:hypothetical protein
MKFMGSYAAARRHLASSPAFEVCETHAVPGRDRVTVVFRPFRGYGVVPLPSHRLRSGLYSAAATRLNSVLLVQFFRTI